MAFEKPVIVIDNGSRYIKAGFSCDNNPVSIFRSVVGRPKYLNGKVGREFYDVHVGDSAVENIQDLDLNSPILKGRIIHWDDMERIWHHIFYRELKAAPEDRSVILGLSALSPIEEKYKCCEVLFEVLNTPAVCIQPQSVLALYGCGLTTGLVVDLGYDSVDINPIYEGGQITYAHISTGIASSQVLQHIKRSLDSRNIDLGYNAEVIIEDIIRNICYVSKNASISLKKKDYDRKYSIPHGDAIDVSMEAFSGLELMFQPHLVLGADDDQEVGYSLQDGVIAAANKCDEELRTDLFETIITCGAIATIPGLNQRLSDEIENVIHKPVNIIAPPEPYTLPWLGGAVFAGMPEAHKLWVTRKQFEENGMKMVRRKFM